MLTYRNRLADTGDAEQALGVEGGGGAANVDAGFRPSSYTGNVSATTTVSGQSIAIASGATRVRVRNLGATNYALVAFGTSASNAESNASNGVAIPVNEVEILTIPENALNKNGGYIAYVADTATVTLNIQQGV